MPLDPAKKMAAYRERKRRGETLVQVLATPALKLAMIEFGLIEQSEADDAAALAEAIEATLADYLGHDVLPVTKRAAS